MVHREIPDDPTLHRQWNDLALRMERPEVFFTCEWALAMQAAYRNFLKPLLFLAYEGELLAGVASLATDPADRHITFLAATTGDYCEFLSDPAQRAEFVEEVFTELAKMTTGSIVLANLPADSNTPAALGAAAAKLGVHLHLRPAYLCSQVELGSSEQRKELKAALGSKKKLRRYFRAMEREGSVTFAHLRSWAEIRGALPGFAHAHIARFLATERSSSLATPERRLFLEELAKRFSDSGIVTLSHMSVGERPVAWNYGFQFHGSWFWYQPTFDRRLEEHSPGYCLLARIVMEACDISDIHRIDLGLGAEGYKERFGNCTRQTLYITVTNSWSRHLREIVRYRAASMVTRSPQLESAVRGLLRRVQRLRGLR
jgi:CelD/BcsL family acetyltransferase involved in cellulose biosynthesis